MRKVEVADPEVFETLWSGFLTPTQRQGYSGEERLNRAVAVLDHLESISVAFDVTVDQLRDAVLEAIAEGRRTQAPVGQVAAVVEVTAASVRSGRKLADDGGAMVMDDEDHRLLLQKIEAVEWTERAARRAAKAIALLKAAPKWTPPAQAADGAKN